MPAADGSPPRTIAVAGASGYVGGRLVPRLLQAGFAVRCLARDPAKVAERAWAHDPRVEVIVADLRDVAGTAAAMHGCSDAYFLVHSMLSAGRAYAQADREVARAFGAAAREAKVGRIIYLGGLGETGAGLSEHLASRRAVESDLRQSLVPVTVLRTAMILGAGSASFEILRYLVERLPIMLTPRWVRTECQPIAVDDLLQCLVACLDEPRTAGRTLDLGGPEVCTYEQLMRTLAEVRGLPRRWIVAVPFLTPRLSALWIHLVTPVPARIARPLAEGLRNRVVCRNDDALELLPRPQLTIRAAIERAFAEQSAGAVPTRWTDAGVVAGDPSWAGGKGFRDQRVAWIRADPAVVFAAVARIGGRNGWYGANWLWRLRGAIDRLLGGPGLGRGRRDPARLAYGDPLDFWRVTECAPGRRLELRAEMKLPGAATLVFELEPSTTGTLLRQVASFRPRGLLGLLYWYSVLPLHVLVFRGLLRGIRRDAERCIQSTPPREHLQDGETVLAVTNGQPDPEGNTACNSCSRPPSS